MQKYSPSNRKPHKPTTTGVKIGSGSDRNKTQDTDPTLRENYPTSKVVTTLPKKGGCGSGFKLTGSGACHRKTPGSVPTLDINRIRIRPLF